MKKEENSNAGFDEALQLSEQIQEKCQIHKALSIGIGAINFLFAVRDKNEPLGNDPDINYTAYLLKMSLNVTKEIDSMTDRLSLMIYNLKKENNN